MLPRWEDPARVPTIQAAAAAGILEFTEGAGGDVSWVLQEAALTRSEFDRPETCLPLPKFVRLSEAASLSSGDPWFGVHLGRVCSVGTQGLPGFLATFAPTVESALTSFARFYHLLGDATDVRFQKSGSYASFTYRVLDRNCWPRRQDAEQVLTMVVSLIRGWLGADWAPTSVCLEHEKSRSGAEIENILGCRVNFNDKTNTIQFDAGAAIAENPIGDARLFQLFCWFAERIRTETTYSCSSDSFKNEVLKCLDTCASAGTADVHSVASALGIEVRTLQRRLHEADCSFRSISDQYLRERALSLIAQSNLSHKEIAHRLGYANINSASSWNRVGDFGLISRLCFLRPNPFVRSAPSFRPDLHARFAGARSGGQGWPVFGPPRQRREASLTAASTTA